MKSIIFDARALNLYPVGKPGFHGGTETYLAVVAHGLAERGWTAHVVTPDLDTMERRSAAEFWWPPTAFPTRADAVVMAHNLANIEPYCADTLILMSNGVDPDLGPDGEWAEGVDLYPCFSQVHVDLLCKNNARVKRENCRITGLGVDLAAYHPTLPKQPGRLLAANDPARGLWHLLDIFEHVRREIPAVTLHVAYDFGRTFELRKWGQTAIAQQMWEIHERLASTPGVVSLGALSQTDLVREQHECHVHCWPSDPPNVGSQIHGLTQMECAAAGVPLVLSDVEAFPEVFGSAAEILPVPSEYVAAIERRIDAQDWADVVVELMRDEQRWQRMSLASRALANQNTWQHVVERWDAMLEAAR